MSRCDKQRPVLPREERHEVALDHERVVGAREPEPPRHAPDVRVHRDAHVGVERVAEHHVGRLAPHAGEGGQRVHVGRHPAAVALDQPLGHRDEVPGLVAVEARGPHDGLHVLHPRRGERGRGRGRRRTAPGDHVDPLVVHCALRIVRTGAGTRPRWPARSARPGAPRQPVPHERGGRGEVRLGRRAGGAAARAPLGGGPGPRAAPRAWAPANASTASAAAALSTPPARRPALRAAATRAPRGQPRRRVRVGPDLDVRPSRRPSGAVPPVEVSRAGAR
jgi:hypothetical protein